VVGEKFDVDSQALFACIAKIGIKDTIEMIHEGDPPRVLGPWFGTMQKGRYNQLPS
jgi:hypothetical protein